MELFTVSPQILNSCCARQSDQNSVYLPRKKNVLNLFGNGQKGEKLLRKKNNLPELICKHKPAKCRTQIWNANTCEKRSRLPLIKRKQFPPKSIVYTIQARLSICIYSDTEKKIVTEKNYKGAIYNKTLIWAVTMLIITKCRLWKLRGVAKVLTNIFTCKILEIIK